MLIQRLREMIGRAGKHEHDAADELQFHLEKEIEKNVASGMTPLEARRRALISFGGVDQTREALREVHGSRILEALQQDLRYGWRMLRKTPGFTIVAVLTLALGIGANTAIFSLIDAIIFRSMPIEDPQSLLVARWQSRKGPGNLSYRNFGDCDESHNNDGNSHGCSLSLPFFKQVQAESGVFSHVAAYTPIGQLDMSGNGPARMIKGEFVTGDYFQTLGVRAHGGRLINLGDDNAGSGPVAVLNYSFWQTEFGASDAAIGKTIRLNGVSFQIVGVTDPQFDALTLSNKYDLMLPMAHRPIVVPSWQAREDQADHWWLVMIGRLKQGVSLSQAEASVSLLLRNSVASVGKPIFKPDSDPRIKLAQASQVLGGTQKTTLQPLYVMMLCVGAVLLIACANVAGLLLARSAVREREIAVRLAMGAKRSRIVMQFLIESVMLAVAGGALGLLVALWGVRALMAMVEAGSRNPPIFSPQLDWRVLAFTSGVSLLTGVLFGLAPALRGSDLSLTSSLKSIEGGAAGPQGKPRRFTAGGALVAVQMALAIVVLVTAGLLVRTLGNLKNLNPGFDTHNVLLFGVDPRLAGYKDKQIDSLFFELQEKFSAIPGVISATYSWYPFLAGGLSSTSFHRPGTPPPSKQEAESGAAEKNQVDSDEYPVGPKFFSTWGIPLQSGRDFTPADYVVAASNTGDKPSSNPTPVIVNQEFARQYFPGKNPLGQIFAEQEPTGIGDVKSPGYLVVGVVANSKYNSLRREITPCFYEPNIGGQAFFELRTGTDPLSLVPTVKNLVDQQNHDLAVFRISTETEAIDRQVFTEKMTARLSSLFGLLALLLACLGLYGLLSYEVTRRTREIGIRMAVGARWHNVIRLVLLKAVGLIAAGAAVGIAAAMGVTRFLASFLYGVKAGDPITLLAVAALLALVALAACYIPARRATKVDPLVALRYE